MARALRVRTRWQRVAGTRPELRGAPAAVRRGPHGVAYPRPRWDGGAFSFSISTRSWPERSWRCSTGVLRAICSMYGASSRSRGARSGLDQGRRPGARRLQPAGLAGRIEGCHRMRFTRVSPQSRHLPAPRPVPRCGRCRHVDPQSVELRREGRLAFLFELSENERSFLDGVLDRGEVNANLLGVKREVPSRGKRTVAPAVSHRQFSHFSRQALNR